MSKTGPAPIVAARLKSFIERIERVIEEPVKVGVESGLQEPVCTLAAKLAGEIPMTNEIGAVAASSPRVARPNPDSDDLIIPEYLRRDRTGSRDDALRTRTSLSKAAT